MGESLFEVLVLSRIRISLVLLGKALIDNSGTLKLLVVFTNGAVLGGQLKQGIGSAKEVKYSYP